MYSSECCSQPSHNKYEVHIVLHIMLLQYPSVGVFVHSFNSLYDTQHCLVSAWKRMYQAGTVSLFIHVVWKGASALALDFSLSC